jgi:hypothetical protein
MPRSSSARLRAPSRTAKALGMRKGSKPCRLRPVGSMSGLRSRSPPGAGRMKRPSSACIMAGSSWSSPAGGRSRRARGRARDRRSWRRGSPACLSGEMPGHQRLDRSRSGGAMRGVGHGQQQVRALGRRRRLADHVQAVRDQGVLELQHARGAVRSILGLARPRPGGLGREVERGGLPGSARRPASPLARARRRQRRASDRGAFRSSRPAVEPGHAPPAASGS